MSLRVCTVMAVGVGSLCAQGGGILGNWQGTLDAGPVKLRLAIHITSNEKGDLTSTLDSLDQNTFGIPSRQTTFLDNKLRIYIPALRADYDGTFNGSEIEGNFTQGGVPMRLLLMRAETVAPPARPQNPSPPFPYAVEEVGYENGDFHLAGTLTLPHGAGPFPAALLITGSGPQDRDETIFGHKPFWVIADYLTNRGFAVLRVDDRVGKSTGNSSLATLDDMTGDVLAGIAFLKGRREIDGRHIGVIGHSEGGIVGPAAAVRSSDIAFVVMLAGTGVSGDHLLYAQAEAVMRSMGETDEAIARNRALTTMIFDSIKSASTPAAALEKMRAEWQTLRPGDAAADATMERQFAMVTSPEMYSFIRHDPAAVLRKLRVPVLALNGSRDVQVPPAQNLPAIATALAEGGNNDFAVVELPGLNHLFQTCNKCTVSEYGDLTETISPRALDAMGDWLLKHKRLQ